MSRLAFASMLGMIAGMGLDSERPPALEVPVMPLRYRVARGLAIANEQLEADYPEHVAPAPPASKFTRQQRRALERQAAKR